MRTPGHYISLQRNATQADFVRPLSMPGVVGVQRRYPWRELQPVGTFVGDRLVRDLNLTAHLGGKLVVFIEDKSFTDERVIPAHLSEYVYKNRQGGDTAARWHPIVQAELQALCAAIYREFTDHPGFGGIALQESAPGLSDEALDASGYDPDVYIRTLIEANCDYLYLNYLPRAQDRLGEVIAGTKAMVGGPDVLPETPPPDDALDRLVYPHFKAAPNRVRQFSSLQFNSFRHIRNDENRYWELGELVKWARENLRVETLFWNIPWPGMKGHTIEDAYAFIAANPEL